MSWTPEPHLSCRLFIDLAGTQIVSHLARVGLEEGKPLQASDRRVGSWSRIQHSAKLGGMLSVTRQWMIKGETIVATSHHGGESPCEIGQKCPKVGQNASTLMDKMTEFFWRSQRASVLSMTSTNGRPRAMEDHVSMTNSEQARQIELNARR